MKRWQYVLIAALFLIVLGGVAAVYADAPDANAGAWAQEMESMPGPEGPPDPGPGQHPHPPRGLRGEVTAVDETGLTLLVRDEMSVQVNVDAQTKIWFVDTQSAGSLADVEAGDRVFVQGRRAEGNALVLQARLIVVAPDGDEVHGRVTAMAGAAITLSTRRPDEPEGEALVITDEGTEFRRCAPGRGCIEGSLSDVSAGKLLVAFGATQADGSLLARLVLIDNRPPPVRDVRGEVTAVGATGLTLLVRDETQVQINVSQETIVWLAESESRGTLADIEVGDKVHVRGTRAEDSSPENRAIDARRIVVAPDGDEAHGRVTEVAGTTIHIRNPEGETSVVVTGETTFRQCAQGRGCREAGLDDVQEGRLVVAFGETQGDGSLLARLVYVHRAPRNRPIRPQGGARGPGGDQLPAPRLGSQPDGAQGIEWEAWQS